MELINKCLRILLHDVTNLLFATLSQRFLGDFSGETFYIFTLLNFYNEKSIHSIDTFLLYGDNM